MLYLLTHLSCFPNEKESPRIESQSSEISEFIRLEGSNLQTINCDTFQFQEVQQRCQQLKKRPHLWTSPTPDTSSTTKQRSSTTHPVPNLEIPLIQKHSITSDCTSKQTSCWEEQALNSKSLEEAFSFCSEILSEKWRQECFFSSSEFLYKNSELNYEEAATLCLQSQLFVSDCLRHLTFIAAQTVPPATSIFPSDWKRLYRHVDDIENYWKDRDPTFLKHHLDLLFAKAIDISYERAAIVAGNPLDFVADTYHHHIYASASYYLMLWEGASSFDLDGWESRIFRALEYRLSPNDKRQPRPYHNRKSKQNWASNQSKKDSENQSIIYRNDGRRIFVPFHSNDMTSKDSHIDMRICVVEAAARVPNGKNILLQAQKDTSIFVRQTAQRHLKNDNK